jgi:hypothetical protein
VATTSILALVPVCRSVGSYALRHCQAASRCRRLLPRLLSSIAPLEFGTHNWSAASTSIVVPVGTTFANVSVQNILAACAPPASFPAYAFIEKKDAFLTVSVSAVPEPESYAMIFAGLFAMGVIVLRKRKG